MVRLVFRPYTQVGRPICTSGPLRASTRVSSGFALPRHSSPSFGSYRTRSSSTSPTERARRAGGAPGCLGRPGIPPQPARAGPHFHCATGFRASPLTRACVRLLGPCFKTGRVGSRHRRRPLAPFVREPVPALGGATQSGRTEYSPLRSTVAPGARGLRPSHLHPTTSEGRKLGERAQRALSPRPRKAATFRARGRCKARGRSREPPSPPNPSWPTRSRSRRTASEEMRPAGARHGPGRGPARGSSHTGRPTLFRRVESPGQTARTPPVYLLTVSRPLELSLQSSFQLSLKVLVDYRSRAGI